LNKKLAFTACALAVSSLALAKLPAPDDAAKAKAAETAAKAAWQAKVDAYKLCQVQDRIAGQYRRSAASRPPVNVPAGATVPTAAAPAAGAKPAAPAAAAVPPSPTPTSPSNATNTAAASQGGGTPAPTVAAAPTIPPCTDPGPFAYHPPAQIPLETSGAHSPAANAATPPSVRPESAQMAPAGPASAQSKKP
jgi:hypothetical protein